MLKQTAAPTHYITQSITHAALGDLYQGQIANLIEFGLSDNSIKILEQSKLAIKIKEMPPTEEEPPDPQAELED